MFPPLIPDLYEGEPVVVIMKRRSLPEAITIRGLIGSTPWMSELAVKGREPREGLSVYWARQKIASLMDQQRHGQDESPLRQAVLDLALAHHLVSKYTSLVAVDVTPVRQTDKMLQTHAMKTNLPEGQNYHAIFGLPKTATSGQAQLLFGLLLFAAAALLWWLRRVAA
jgi:Ca-activated chloride channel family protein